MRVLLVYPNFRLPYVFDELAVLGAHATIVHPPGSTVPADLPLPHDCVAVDVHGDPAGSLRALEALHRERRYDLVFTVNELCVLFCAQLARDLGLRGFSPRTGLLARDKSRMRAAFSAAGLNTPGFTLELAADGSLPPHMRFPVVAKPVAGAGSQGVVRAEDAAELRAALAVIGEINRESLDTLSDAKVGRMSGYLVEEYIEGKEYAADCFAQDGTVYTLSLCEKNDLRGPYFEERSYICPARLSGEVLARALAEVAGGVLALGITDGPAHAEFRIRADGRPYLLEIGARVGGGGLVDHFISITTGVRPIRLTIANLLGGADVRGLATAPDPHGAAANYLVPTGSGGVVTGIDGLDEVLRRPETSRVVQFQYAGAVIPAYPKFTFYPAFVLSRHRDYDDALAFHDFLDRTVRVRYADEPTGMVS